MNRAWKSIVSSVMAGLMTVLLMSPVFAGTEASQKVQGRNISAEQLEKIRGVGRSLLQAKRSVQPDAEGQQIRQDVQKLATLLNALTSPLPQECLVLNPAGPQAGSLESQSAKIKSASDPWREHHAEQIAQLTRLADRLGEQSRALSPATLAPADVSGGQATGQRPARGPGRVLAPVTAAMWSRLGSLRAELDEALSLPAAERPAALAALQKKVAPAVPGRQEATLPAVEETPTIVSGTRHRPMPK